MRLDLKDFAAGALMTFIGAAFLVGALLRLEIGTAFRMGPGYFPMVLGGLLGALGLTMMIGSIGRATEGFGAVPWRGIVFTCVGPILFSLSIERLGLAPALALAVIAASLASPEAGPKRVALLTVTITMFCVLLFHYALNLPIPLFGYWIKEAF